MTTADISNFTSSVLGATIDLFNGGVLWKILLFVGVVVLGRSMLRIQQTASNEVDFYDLIRDFSIPNAPLSRVGAAYMGCFVCTSLVYLIVCTHPGVTMGDITTATLTYGGLWAGAQVLNKYSEKQPAPVQKESEHAGSE